jgi:peptidoglycan/LPS O-acetylase OafA/YrhL
MSRRRALDGLRGVAILWVVAYHYVALPARAAGLQRFPLLLVLADYGWIGVNLFFVLSGYLITQGLAGQPGDGRAFWGFWAKRAFRIVPAYALLLLSFPLARALWPASAPGAGRVFNSAIPLWSYLVFAQNLYMAPLGYLGNDWLRVLWSLAVEVQFYLFISVALLLIPARRRVPWLALLAAACVAFRFSLYLTRDGAQAALVVLLPSRLDGFLFGGLLALAPRRPARPARTAASLALLAAAAAFMAILHRGGFRGMSMYAVPLYYTVLSVGCAALLDLCASPTGPVERLMGSPPLVEAGRLSYFIYLFHMPVALCVFHFGLGTAPALGGAREALAMAAAFAGVCALAKLSFACFENPLIRYSHALAARPQAAPGAPA